MIATANIQLRPGEVSDAPHYLGIVRSAEVADGDPMVTTLAEVEEWFDEPGQDPAMDMRLALVDDTPAGFAIVHFEPSGIDHERAYLSGAVSEPQRGIGVGSALLDWAVDRARTRLLDQPGELPLFIRTEFWDWCDGTHQLFADHGFSAVRWFRQMLRPLGDLPPIAPPVGIDIVPWDAARSEELRLVHNLSFADHWGSTPTPSDSWDSNLRGHGTRLDLSYMALEAEGSIVGMALNGHYPDDEVLFGRREGYVQSLGTLREWRCRGVASALIRASLQRFADAGLTHAGLGVDTDNPSGAHGLYAALGFEPTFGSVAYQLAVER